MLQWNLSNLETLGAEDALLISGVEIWDSKSVLFIKVSSFQGVLIRGVPLYILVYIF